MNNVQEFNNSALGKCRVIGNQENPLFCLKDVCEILEISNNSDVKASIINEFGDGVDLIYPIVDNLGRTQEATFITEPQLYFVLMRSDKRKAKPFRQWVINEVLPSIRKTGGYGIAGKDNVLSNLYEKVIDLQSQVMVLQEKVSNIQIGQLMCRQDKYNSERFRKEIIRLYNDGYSTRVIAKMFGVSINKVLEILDI